MVRISRHLLNKQLTPVSRFSVQRKRSLLIHSHDQRICRLSEARRQGGSTTSKADNLLRKAVLRMILIPSIPLEDVPAIGETVAQKKRPGE
jgi:hypothetical protein